MKKNIIGLVTMISTMLLLVGCQGEAAVEKSEGAEFIEGQWKLIRIESRDVVIEGEELQEMYNGGVFYTFEEDGTASILAQGTVVEGTWEERGDLGERFLMRLNDEDIIVEKEYDYVVARPDGILMTFQRSVE